MSDSAQRWVEFWIFGATSFAITVVGLLAAFVQAARARSAADLAAERAAEVLSRLGLVGSLDDAQSLHRALDSLEKDLQSASWSAALSDAGEGLESLASLARSRKLGAEGGLVESTLSEISKLSSLALAGQPPASGSPDVLRLLKELVDRRKYVVRWKAELKQGVGAALVHRT